jgi:hypothetical protein
MKTYPDLGREHTNDLNEKIKYNSDPPTSGKHYQTPAIWGDYPTPINQIQGVHNLEHGGVLIQYGDRVPRATVEKFRAYYQQDPNAMLLAPYPRLRKRIAITTWTHLMMCTGYDEHALDEVKRLYRYKGPEHFAPNELEPGE